MFGDDYPTEDGTCIRDYIHVMDLAQAHYQAVKKPIRTNESAIYNLGNGQGFSVKHVINTSRTQLAMPSRQLSPRDVQAIQQY